MLVAEQGANQIRRLSSTGQDLGVFASFSTEPVALRFGPDGNIYTAGQNPGGAFRFAPDGTFLNFFSLPQGFLGWDIAFTQTGDVLLGDAGNGTIWRHTADGTFQGAFASGLGTISGILEMPNGDFLVSDALFGIRRISSTGASLGNFSTAVSNPVQMVLDQSGNVLVIDHSANGAVRKLSSTGQDLGVFSANLSWAWGIELDDQNGYLVSLSQKSGPNRIVRLGADGTNLGSFTGVSLDSPEGMIYVVPEPGTVLGILIGTGFLLLRAKRRR